MNRCKPWKGYINMFGYGICYYNGRSINAHRTIYIEAHGEIKAGYDVDHICRNRACVELTHLRLLTHKENSLLGNNPISENARKTSCKHGHLLSGKNLYIAPDNHRQCRSCAKTQRQRYNQKKAGGN